MVKIKCLVIPLLLGGCVVGPDYSGPPPLGHAAPRSTFVRGAMTTVTNDLEPSLAKWWVGLKDPVLDELEQRALASNPSIDIAQARLRQVGSSVRMERANRFPTAGAQGTAIIADLPGIDLQSNNASTSAPASAPSTQDQDTSLRFYNLGLNANWEIDLAGGQVRKIEAANALAAAAVYNVADAQIQLTTEVAQAYTNLRDWQQRLAAHRHRLELQEEEVQLTRQRFQQGTVSNLAVRHADRDVQSTKSDLAAAEAEVETYLNALSVLVGEAPGSLDPLLASLSDIPLPPQNVVVGDPASLLRRRPDIRAAERNLAAATARIGVATAARFPKIKFMGVLGIGGTSVGDLVDLGNISNIAVPQLQSGLLDFGRTSAAISQARAGRDEAEAQYRQVVLSAFQDAENSLARFAQQRRNVAALADLKRSADESAELMRQRYQRQVISKVDGLEVRYQQLLAPIDIQDSQEA